MGPESIAVTYYVTVNYNWASPASETISPAYFMKLLWREIR